MMKKTLILTDNYFAYELAKILNNMYGNIAIFQSPHGPLKGVPRLSVRENAADLLRDCDLVISIHCKEIFPAVLVNNVRCINVHPGLNPYNRGWYPQVFSIINGLPSGVTIHEIDNRLDHGLIIAQREYTIQPWDTSGTAYAKIMALERELVLENFISIREGTYKPVAPKGEGNINYQKDYEHLKHIDLDQTGTFRDFINRLRALTHENYRNAYFKDPSGKKVFVKIMLEPEDS